MKKLALILGTAGLLFLGYQLLQSKSVGQKELSSTTISPKLSEEKKYQTKDKESLAVPTRNSASTGGRNLDIAELLKSYDSSASWRIDKANDGRTIAISGGLIPIREVATAGGKLQFAQQILSSLGIPGAQLLESSDSIPETPYADVWKFDQSYHGYRVLGAFLKVFSRNEDGSIYFIANEVRSFKRVDTDIKYDVNVARDVVMDHFSNSNGVSIDSAPAEPFIFSTDAQHGELAWQVEVTIQGPPRDRRRVIVSAVTARILNEISHVQR